MVRGQGSSGSFAEAEIGGDNDAAARVGAEEEQSAARDAERQVGDARTWVDSQWKSPGCLGQFSAQINRRTTRRWSKPPSWRRGAPGANPPQAGDEVGPAGVP